MLPEMKLETVLNALVAQYGPAGIPPNLRHAVDEWSRLLRMEAPTAVERRNVVELLDRELRPWLARSLTFSWDSQL